IPQQTQGVPSGLIPIASFTDANPLATVADFTATIDWGDGTPQSAGRITQTGQNPPTTSGTFTVSGNHVFAQPGTYTLTVYVQDDGGSRLTLNPTVTVVASTIVVTPQMFSAVEGQPVINVLVATFTDSGIPGPISSYSASISWNDGTPGTTNAGQIVLLGGNVFGVYGSLPTGYPEEGTFNVSVTVSHNGVIVAGS